MRKQLTLLWQDTQSWHHEWILEVLSPLIGRQVFDGRHEIVLDDCIVVDANIQLVDPAYFARFRGKNAFLFREPDEFLRDVSLDAYRNFRGVFRMHHSAAFRPERVMHIPVGYPRGEFRRNEPKPASLRQYAWAMLGQMNKSTRPEAMTALLGVEPNYWYASDGWRPGADVSLNYELANRPSTDYLELISEAAFCPSPMGNVSQESGRPYAALEAGSIPILEKTLLMDVHRRLLGKHPLPTFSNWKKAAEFIREMWADKRALDQLQLECLSWWANYKRNIAEDAAGFVDRLWNREPEEISAYIRFYARLPGWPVLELARHHSMPALTRRIKRQGTRLMQHGKLFERF